MGLTTPSRKKNKKNTVMETEVRETIIGGDGDDTNQGTVQMTAVKRAPQGVDTLTVDSLKPKEKNKIACWNVRTLYKACPSGKRVSKLWPRHCWGL